MKGPIFLENPDGTITEAIPAKQKKSRPRGEGSRDSQGGRADSDSGPENAQVNLYREVEFLYSRHEKVFMLLLATQLCLEGLYNLVYIVRMQPSLLEFLSMYHWRIKPQVAEFIIWFVFVVQACYSFVYYLLAGTAVWTKRPRHYRSFSNWSVLGIAMLVLLAYVDKFNLLVFFLRVLASAYGRFMQNLSANLLLLPPTNLAVV